MSLNISHQKRYHVWNEANKARVRRDEKEHAAKVEAGARRKAAVEAEARLDRLKQRAIPSLKRGDSDAATGAAVAGAGAPAQVTDAQPPVAPLVVGGAGSDWREDMAMRAFAVSGSALRAGAAAGTSGGRGAAVTHAPNPEHEAERKAAELRELKKRGYDPWKLGEGAAETTAHKPWYHYAQAAAAPVRNRWGKAVTGLEAKLLTTREERRKVARDPAADIVRALTKKTGKVPTSILPPSLPQRTDGAGNAVPPPPPLPPSASPSAPRHASDSDGGSSSSRSRRSVSDSESTARRRRRQRKHSRREVKKRHSRHHHQTAKSSSKRHKRSAKRRKSSDDGREARRKAKDAAKASKLAELRAARLARERVEQRREGMLFVQDAEQKTAEEAARTVPVYSSQFNPAFARQNRR